jgi:hypothetical protein
MPGTVYTDLNTIHLCNADEWSDQGGTNSLNTDIYVEGSGCCHNYSAGAAARGADYDFGGTGGSSALSGKVIYCWFAFSKKENIPVKGANGMRLRLQDTSGNYSEWDIFGKDTLPHGGWIAWCLDPSTTRSRGSGTLNMSSIRYVGWRCGTAGTTVVGKTYIYFDAFRYGTYLGIYGGTSGSPADFASMYAEDVANAYGVIDYAFGIYYVQGKLKFGDTSSTNSTYFKDTSQVIVFKDAFVASSFYDIGLAGNSTGTTEVYFGALSGGRGISGCMFRRQSASQTATYTLTATDSYLTKMGLYGTTFLNAGQINLPAYNADKKVISCNFESCAGVVGSTCTITYCNFISAAGSGLKLASISHYTTYCNFINCADGVEITAAGDAYPFPALMFSGCTYDVNNSSTGAVYIDPTYSSNVSTYHNTNGGTTTINAVQLTLTINDIIDGSDVVIYEAGTTTVIEDSQENSGTYYDYVYPSTEAGDFIDIGLFKAGYRPYYIRSYELLSSDSSLPCNQQIDRYYLI